MSVKSQKYLNRAKAALLIIAITSLFSASLFCKDARAKGATAPIQITLTQYPKEITAGDAALMTLTPNRDVISVTGSMYGNRVIFFQKDENTKEYHALVGTDINEKDPTRTLTVTVEYAPDVKKEYGFDIKIKTVEYPEEKLTVPKKMVTPPKEVAPRIKEEREAVLSIYGNPISIPLFGSGFMLPLNAEISSTFGMRRFYNGIKKPPHNGVDLKGQIGKTVMASNYGTVVMAQDLYFTGNTVLIDHGAGLFSAYFHLNEIYKEVNDLVKKGEEIGAIGMTGRVTGPHLHFGVKLNGFYVNPLSIISLSEKLFAVSEKVN